jgi:hypothetical protein
MLSVTQHVTVPEPNGSLGHSRRDAQSSKEERVQVANSTPPGFLFGLQDALVFRYRAARNQFHHLIHVDVFPNPLLQHASLSLT